MMEGEDQDSKIDDLLKDVDELISTSPIKVSENKDEAPGEAVVDLNLNPTRDAGIDVSQSRDSTDGRAGEVDDERMDYAVLADENAVLREELRKAKEDAAAQKAADLQLIRELDQQVIQTTHHKILLELTR